MAVVSPTMSCPFVHVYTASKNLKNAPLTNRNTIRKVKPTSIQNDMSLMVPPLVIREVTSFLII
ncbi:hypothetical protein D3C81_2044340 [compost metagenome]